MSKQAIFKEDIIQLLDEVGVKTGDVVEVHSALSSLGYVIGGPQTVVEALQEVLTKQGTIVMALQNSSNSEPGYWERPAVDFNLYHKIREKTPIFQPGISCLSHMGLVVEYFSHLKDVVYSNHPNTAFVAWGSYAQQLCANQSLDFPIGLNSPIYKMINLQAKVLLIGVDYDSVTSFHYGEYLSKCRPIVLDGSKTSDGEWTKYLEIQYNSDDFMAVGKTLQAKKLVKQLPIAKGFMRYFMMFDGVEATCQYIKSLE